jgi:hypothetical protein
MLYRKLHMNKRKFISIGVIMAIIILLTASAHAKDLKVRPIKIKVVDAVTKKPLEGITVNYILQTYTFKKRVLLFFKNIEPKIKSNIELSEKRFTDENGEVNFPLRELEIKRNRALEEEKIIINLAVDMENDLVQKLIPSYENELDFMNHIMGTPWKSSKYLINPNNKYKGFYLHSRQGWIDLSKYPDTKQEKFNILWNIESMTTKSEEFTIELEPYGN